MSLLCALYKNCHSLDGLDIHRLKWFSSAADRIAFGVFATRSI